MIMTMIIGIVTALPWTIAFMFSTTDYNAIALSDQPLFDIFSQAIENEKVATFFICWFLVLYLGCAISNIATVGRQTWAFARDNGLPYSNIFSKVHPTLQMPLNATVLCGTVCITYGAIYCGSTMAFNSFLNASILFINLSYVIPQAIVVYRGRSKTIPKRYLNLGAFGAFCNIFSTAWVAFYIVIFCFPTNNPPTVQNMNYVAVVFVGAMLIIIAVWLCGKKSTFTGPVSCRNICQHTKYIKADFVFIRKLLSQSLIDSRM
jgi:choline transport protein